MYFYENLLRTTLEADGGPTIRQLSQEIGVPSATLNDWLVLNKKPHLKNLVRIAEWSGYPLPALFVQIDTSSNLDERIILNLPHLSPEQKQQIVSQMELFTEQNRAFQQ